MGWKITIDIDGYESSGYSPVVEVYCDDHPGRLVHGFMTSGRVYISPTTPDGDSWEDWKNAIEAQMMEHDEEFHGS